MSVTVGRPVLKALVITETSRNPVSHESSHSPQLSTMLSPRIIASSACLLLISYTLHTSYNSKEKMWVVVCKAGDGERDSEEGRKRSIEGFWRPGLHLQYVHDGCGRLRRRLGQLSLANLGLETGLDGADGPPRPARLASHKVQTVLL